MFDWVKTSVFGRDISTPYCLKSTYGSHDSCKGSDINTLTAEKKASNSK